MVVGSTIIGPAPSGPSGSGPAGPWSLDSKELRTKKTESDERSFLYREQLVCLFACVSHKNALKTGLKRVWKCGEKKFGHLPWLPDMSSDYRNKQYQDGNKMCEKKFGMWSNSRHNRLEILFLTERNPANKILWRMSHRIQKGTCTWKDICYETIRHLHLEMSSIIQRDFPCTHSSCRITWFWCDWLKKNWNVAVLN